MINWLTFMFKVKNILDKQDNTKMENTQTTSTINKMTKTNVETCDVIINLCLVNNEWDGL